MGRRPVKNKRTPAEYPQFAFRVSMENKDRLNALIEEVQAQMNKSQRQGEPYINKNDVIVAALEKGLRLLKK